MTCLFLVTKTCRTYIHAACVAFPSGFLWKLKKGQTYNIFDTTCIPPGSTSNCSIDQAGADLLPWPLYAWWCVGYYGKPALSVFEWGE